MKTKAQELGITEFPYCERDKNGYISYSEYSNGNWHKWKRNDKGDETYREYTSGNKQYIIR